jgi:hypothetical protein
VWQYAPVDDIATLVGAAMASSVSLHETRALVRALFSSHDSEAIGRKVSGHTRCGFFCKRS